MKKLNAVFPPHRSGRGYRNQTMGQNAAHCYAHDLSPFQIGDTMTDADDGRQYIWAGVWQLNKCYPDALHA